MYSKYYIILYSSNLIWFSDILIGTRSFLFYQIETENDYDIAEITETKPEMEDQYVVVVSSIDLCEPKHKDTVLVQPVLNPYYGERTSDISGGNKNVSFVLE